MRLLGLFDVLGGLTVFAFAIQPVNPNANVVAYALFGTGLAVFGALLLIFARRLPEWFSNAALLLSGLVIGVLTFFVPSDFGQIAMSMGLVIYAVLDAYLFQRARFYAYLIFGSLTYAGAIILTMRVQSPIYPVALVTISVAIGVSVNQLRLKQLETALDYRLLAENASDLVYRSDPQGKIVWVSPSIEGVLGWRISDVIDRDVFAFVHPDDRDTIARERDFIYQGEVRPKVQLRFLTKVGHYKYLSVEAKPIVDERDVVIGVVVGARDVDDDVRGRQEAEARDARFRATIMSQIDAFSLFTGVRNKAGEIVDIKFVDANAAALEFFKTTKEEIVGKTMLELMPDERDAPLFRQCLRCISTGEPVVLNDYLVQNSQISPGKRLDVRAFSAGDELAVTWRDVTEQHEASEILEHLATDDDLTGLLNRRAGLSQLGDVAIEDRRAGKRSAILFCDLDKFKAINDTFGHEVGDEVLRTVAERIRLTIRSNDIAARLGGDEFLIILRRVGDLGDAEAVAHKVLAAVTAPATFDHADVAIRMSIGVTLLRPDEVIDAAVARADDAMYEAKHSGIENDRIHVRA